MKLAFEVRQTVTLDIPQEVCDTYLPDELDSTLDPQLAPAEIAEQCRQLLEELAAGITQECWEATCIEARIEEQAVELDEYRFTATSVLGVAVNYDFADDNMATYSFLNSSIDDCCFHVMQEFEVESVHCIFGRTKLWRRGCNGEDGWLLAISETEYATRAFEEFEFNDKLELLDTFKLDTDDINDELAAMDRTFTEYEEEL